jgi:hypothetical protein
MFKASSQSTCAWMLLSWLVLPWCPALRAWGDTATFQFTISAGPHERNNVPVRVPVPASPVGRRAASVTLTQANGEAIPAQVTGPSLTSGDAREVWFVLRHLPAGAAIRLRAALSTDAPPRAGGFDWHDNVETHTVLRFGERPVLTYHYERLDESTPASRVRTYKVFHHLFSPSDDRIVTSGLSDDPQVHSPHHRGIFFGFNRITYGNGKSADVWHCTDGAYQEHDAFLAVEQGQVLGRHRVAIGWHGADENRQAFVQEQRELTVYRVPGGHLIEFSSRLSSPAGRVRLDGDPQHAGFHFRAHNDVHKLTSQETIFVRPDGAGQPGETRNWDPQTRQGPVDLPWNAMSFVLRGKRYTAAYLDHPQNPKQARFSERAYGRFGSYFEYTIEEGHPLTVNYRLWLQEGLMNPQEIAALSRDFVEPVTITVESG